MDINPAIKLLLRERKNILIDLTNTIGINTLNKNKKQLAQEIAEYQEKEQLRIYRVISNPKK